jgi:FMN phosphatase YigB (HAD superfamily)
MSNLKETFGAYADKPVLIYGTGWMGQNLKNDLPDGFRVVAFSNSYGEHRELLGVPVLPFEEAVERYSIGLVIVAAQLVTCRMIAKGVGPLCRERGIALCDPRGIDLLAIEQARYDLSNLSGHSKAELLEDISNHDVISFDLFDTLVARNVLYPSDVFACVDAALRERGVAIEGFAEKRKAAEKKLSRTAFPRLTDIYRELLLGSPQDGVSVEALAETEWQTDLKLMLPRQAVCELFREAAGLGKTVCVVSDTWYTEGQIARILQKCGIANCDRIISSCEYGRSKGQGLFRELAEREKGRRILHIGDDYAADISCAEKEGFTARHIYSGLELFESAGRLGLPTGGELPDRIKLGMLVAKLFNSPFWFEGDDRSIRISDVYDFGYLFFGPVLSSFSLWLQQRIRANGEKNVWFCARDGYLVQKMYRLLEPEDAGVYFLTSRVAAMRTGLKSAADIENAERSAFHGTLGEHLRERYGVSLPDAETEETGDRRADVLRRESEILAASARARRNTEKYIDGIEKKPGGIALIDGVGRGTTQLYLEKLLTPHIKGYYLMRLEDDGQGEYGGMDAEALYDGTDRYNSAMFDTYYLLEFLMTSPQPCALGFDDAGEPVYKAESRSEEEIRCCMRGQEGVLDYFRTYLEVCPRAQRGGNLALDDAVLSLVRKLPFENGIFRAMRRDDSLGNHKETAGAFLLQN